MHSLVCCLFFFQAEDGIRDKLVTGVQTCALPIYYKDPTDAHWANDSAMKQWQAFMKKYYPDGNLIDALNVYGYTVAATLHELLRKCGDNLTRENVMRQAASMKGWRVDTLLPGITITTSQDDFAPIQSVQLQRFNGKQWELFGEVISSN